MTQSSQSYSQRPTCYRPRRQWCAHGHLPHSRRAHRVVFISSCSSRPAHRVLLVASCSSCRAQHFVSYLPTFLCFCTKCGSSIYRCTLDKMNRTGLSHYAWNPLRVCECDKSICCDISCIDSQRDRGAMTHVVQMPFALTRQRPEGKCPDMAASRRKMPGHGCVQKENTLTWLRSGGKCPDTLRPVSRCCGELRPDAQCRGVLRPDARCHGKLRSSFAGCVRSIQSV